MSFAGTVFVRTRSAGLSVSMHADAALRCWREEGLLHWGGWLLPHSGAGRTAILEDGGQVVVEVEGRSADALCEAPSNLAGALRVTGSGEPPFEHQFGS